MTTTAILMKEIETMPEKVAIDVLNYAMFLKGRQTLTKQPHRIATKDAYGIFKDLKGMDTTIERNEEDRI